MPLFAPFINLAFLYKFFNLSVICHIAIIAYGFTAGQEL